MHNETMGRVLEVVKTEASFGIVGDGTLEEVGFLVVEFGKIIDPFDRVSDIVKRFHSYSCETVVG
jgi:transposase